MYKQKNQYRKFYLFASLLSLALVNSGCKKEINRDLPSYQIAESERLFIFSNVDLPANFPLGNTRVATFYAEGVQKYKAQLKSGSNPSAYEWVFVAPQANLYDATNKKAGTHSAGPSWQLTGIADSIFGQQFSPPRTAVSSDPNGVDWLLLMPKNGKSPSGIFSSVSYIQRIATKGGKAPAIPPQNATDTVDVKYTAIYRFTKKN